MPPPATLPASHLPAPDMALLAALPDELYYVSEAAALDARGVRWHCTRFMGAGLCP